MLALLRSLWGADSFPLQAGTRGGGQRRPHQLCSGCFSVLSEVRGGLGTKGGGGRTPDIPTWGQWGALSIPKSSALVSAP